MGKKFTIANLVPEENYAIQVRSSDNGENSKWSVKYSFKTIDDKTQGGPNGGEPSVPAATTLHLWETSSAGFTAEWDAVIVMVGGHTTVTSHYDMEFADTGTGNTVIWKFYTAQKPLVRLTLSLDTMYSILGGMPANVTLRVRAVNSTGNEGEWSNSLTCSMGTPDPPTNAVVVEAVDQIRLSWTAPVNKNFLTGYRVYTGNVPGFTPSPANRIYQGESTSFSYATATYALQYFKIRSYNQVGTESTDLLASGTPKTPFIIDTTPPAVPGLSGNLSTSSTLPRFAELAWTFNAGTPGNEDIAGFVVQWRKTGDTIWKQNFYDKAARAGSIELPLPFADYEFKIASYDNVANYSTFSTPVLSLSGGIPGPPAQVTGVTSTASLDTFRITWTANTEADVIYGGHYDVDIATNSGFTTGLQSYSTGETEISIAGLAPNTTYYYRVRAEDVGGSQGVYSATGSRLTPDYAPAKSDGAAPSTSPTPTLVQGIGYLTAIWQRITNNDLVTYEVHISTSSGFTPGAGTHLTDTTATSTIIRTNATDTALVYGTTYYVKIIAKDADGAAAASAQASASVLQATNADVSDVSAGKLTAGTVSAATIVLGSGGIFRTNNSDVIITDTGITVGANSSISAAAMQAGTAFVDDLTIQSTFTINTTGVMKSSNYSPGVSGWQLSNNALDIRSGTVAAGTLVAGTITSPGIVMGSGGVMTIDATGVIKSNNYSPGVTGWQISSNGIQMNDANSSISVAALETGTLTSTIITLGSGGALRSANWNGTSTGFSLSDTGLTMYTGTVYSAAVYTNQLASIATDANSPLTPIPGQSQGAAFGINAAGKAVFSGALIYGNTVMGASGSHFVQSGIFTPGSVGWKIDGSGYAEFSSLNIYGNAKVRGTLSSGGTRADGTTPLWQIETNGSARFDNPSIIIGNQASGTVWLVANGNRGEIRLYPTGHTPGVSSFFHYIYGGVNGWGYALLDIRGAGGGAVSLHDQMIVPNVGWVGNCVSMSVNANVSNNLYVDNYIRTGGGGLGSAGPLYTESYIQTLQSIHTPQINGNPQFAWMQPGEARVVQVGGNGYLSPCSFRPGQVQLTSSQRYKKNIIDMPYTKDQILSLRPVEFEYNADLIATQTQEPGRQPGFIAEEVQAAGLDKLIWYDKQNRPEGFKYGGFTAALLKVAQEQQAEIDDLRTRLEALEA